MTTAVIPNAPPVIPALLCHPERFIVILSEAKDLATKSRQVDSASLDSSPSAQNDTAVILSEAKDLAKRHPNIVSSKDS